jgi:putative membrane protein
MIPSPRKTVLYAALLSLGVAMSASAQTNNAATSGTSNPAPKASATAPGTSGATKEASAKDKLARGDRKFIEQAAQGGMAEVELGKLAVQKAQSDQVKQFGQRMVDDHSKANDQLKQIAESKGVTLPASLDSKDKRELDRLSKLSGADFDREYMKHMVSDHKNDVKEFKSEAKSAKDAELKSFASSTEPVLEQHLQLAQTTDAAVRKAGKSNTAKTSASTVAPGTTSASSMTGNSGGYGSTGQPSTAAPSSTGSAAHASGKSGT